jgi:oxygen-independent coproporphyrinogen-3 oxidase
VQNVSQELGWRAAVSAHDLPIARGVAITPEDCFRGAIIERLMCDLEVDLAAVCARHGRTVADLADELAVLDGFERDGLVRHDGTCLTVTDPGRVLVRSVCAVFDTHLAPQARRHSKAL